MCSNPKWGEELAGSLQKERNTKRPMFVTVLTHNDILMGRGANVDNFEGNRRFRELVRERKNEYVSNSRTKEKQAIAQHVIQTINNRGGSFVRKVTSPREANRLGVPEGKEAWTFVDDKIVLEKVKQALRSESTSTGKQRAQNTDLKRKIADRAAGSNYKGSLPMPTENSSGSSMYQGQQDIGQSGVSVEGSSEQAALPFRNTVTLNVDIPELTNSLMPTASRHVRNLLTLQRLIANTHQFQHQLSDSRVIPTGAAFPYDQPTTTFTAARLQQLQQRYSTPVSGLAERQNEHSVSSLTDDVIERSTVQSHPQLGTLSFQNNIRQHQHMQSQLNDSRTISTRASVQYGQIPISSATLRQQLQQLNTRNHYEQAISSFTNETVQRSNFMQSLSQKSNFPVQYNSLHNQRREMGLITSDPSIYFQPLLLQSNLGSIQQQLWNRLPTATRQYGLTNNIDLNSSILSDLENSVIRPPLTSDIGMLELPSINVLPSSGREEESKVSTATLAKTNNNVTTIRGGEDKDSQPSTSSSDSRRVRHVGKRQKRQMP